MRVISCKLIVNKEMNKIILNIITLLLINSTALAETNKAGYIANGFFITDKYFDFEKKIPSAPGKCSGRVPYPYLESDEEDIFIMINYKIEDFINIYTICNKGDRSNFSVNYEVLVSNSPDYFSILWMTKKDNKLWRIDSLNFNTENGDLLFPDDVFSLLAGNMMHKMIELSEGHLKQDATWEDFLAKIESRDIQFYIHDKEWYIVFNSTKKLDKIVRTKIPEYFIQGGDVTK